MLDCRRFLRGAIGRNGPVADWQLTSSAKGKADSVGPEHALLKRPDVRAFPRSHLPWAQTFAHRMAGRHADSLAHVAEALVTTMST